MDVGKMSTHTGCTKGQYEEKYGKTRSKPSIFSVPSVLQAGHHIRVLYTVT